MKITRTHFGSEPYFLGGSLFVTQSQANMKKNVKNGVEIRCEQ